MTAKTFPLILDHRKLMSLQSSKPVAAGCKPLVIHYTNVIYYVCPCKAHGNVPLPVWPGHLSRAARHMNDRCVTTQNASCQTSLGLENGSEINPRHRWPPWVSGPLGKSSGITPRCLLCQVLLHLLSIPQKPHMPGLSVGMRWWPLLICLVLYGWCWATSVETEMSHYPLVVSFLYQSLLSSGLLWSQTCYPLVLIIHLFLDTEAHSFKHLGAFTHIW